MYTLQYSESKMTIQIHAVSYLNICNHGSPYTHTLAYKQTNKQTETLPCGMMDEDLVERGTKI
jgi:hypothetical protein